MQTQRTRMHSLTGKYSASSDDSWRKRSNRAEECSGPCQRGERGEEGGEGERLLPCLACSQVYCISLHLSALVPPPGPHHPFIAVGQEHDEAALSHPLVLPTADELINDALSRVVEVAKLGLPAHQRIGVGLTETQFKSYDTKEKWKQGLHDWATVMNEQDTETALSKLHSLHSNGAELRSLPTVTQIALWCC